MTDEDRTSQAELDPAVVEDYMVAVLVRDGYTVTRTADRRYSVVAPDGSQPIAKDAGDERDTLTLTELVRYARALVGDGEPPQAEELVP